MVSGLPWRSLAAPACTRIQPSLTQYSSTLFFSTPLKRMPTSRCRTSALNQGLRGSTDRRSGGVSAALGVWSRVSSFMARLSHSGAAEASRSPARRRLRLERQSERDQHDRVSHDRHRQSDIELVTERLRHREQDCGARQHRDDPHDLECAHWFLPSEALRMFAHGSFFVLVCVADWILIAALYFWSSSAAS